MAKILNGTTQYIQCGNPTISGTVYSVSVWAQPSANTGTWFGRTNTASGNPIYFILDLSAGTARMLVRDEAGNTAFSTKASAYSAGTWTHMLGVRNGNNSLVYVNGVAGTPASGSLGMISSGTANDVVDIGARALGSSARTAYLNGNVAEPAIWTAELNAEEAVALAGGISARKIRTSSLVFYSPLIVTSQDLMGLATLTEINSPGTTNHTRIYP